MTTEASNVSYINSLAPDQAREAFFRCSGSNVWSDQMVKSSPFIDTADLLAKVDCAWELLSQNDWLEAFEIHPKIGDLESLRKKFASTSSWTTQEQAGAAQATEEVLQGLALGNQEYQDKFGYIFIVCATGKPANELLAILRQRLPNNADVEFKIACNEQKKITKLRLEKLQP